MSYEGECDWFLDVESVPADAKTPMIDVDKPVFDNPLPLASISTGLSEDDEIPVENVAPLDGKIRMQMYLDEITKLNTAIDEFSKIIQTLALFKYYIRNRKGNTNVEELHKRFNSFSVKCANKIRSIQQHVLAVNKDNHFAMAHREKLNFSYSDLRARFNMQDASVNRLKTLMETYQSVIKEYTVAAKNIEVNSQPGTVAQPAAKLGTTAVATEAAPATPEDVLMDELKSKSKDILTLEKNAKDLNQLFAELNMTIKKRGENIYKLEQQILLSSEQIDKGKEDMAYALKARGGQGVYWMCILIALGTCALVLPSPIRSAVFRTQ
ncbi:hypothetical protein X943_003284 [Babesia divergens]|uniref:Uncharacterized protein n=1 Tax=Babesia divergens TaxID=32595 RepID=A0AAD9GDH6_BABDI|nr:hypothetical protein X943_003284 [Babesia divergens]